MDFSRLETSSKIGDGWIYPAAQATNSGWLEVDAEGGTASIGRSMAPPTASR